MRQPMRWLAPSLLVALSLVFSTGGVAVVGRADSTSPAKPPAQQSGEPVQAMNPAAQLPTECAVPTRPSRTTVVPSTLGKPGGGPRSIVLNTSGYNYPIEGQWRPEPVGRPQGVPDGVLPRDEPAPAAPEAK